MAKCGWCKQEMMAETTTSCIGNSVVDFPDGTSLPAIPAEEDVTCSDCGVKNGGFHHPGCDREQCPRGRGQLISCNCFDLVEDD
jgi:hypothetical protein